MPRLRRRFFSSVVLDTDGLTPPLLAQSATMPVHPAVSQAFTPFTPEEGYHVTLEDFDPKLRPEKIVDMRADSFRILPYSTLYADVLRDDQDAANALGLVDERTANSGERQPLFGDELAARLNQLRFQVDANGLRVESRPEQRSWGVRYEWAYPQDTGPLAVPWSGYHEGLLIAIPPDPVVLSQLLGRFVFTGA